jgi:dTDP-4-dehydrorhamnose reductase
MHERVLITGKDGQLGKSLERIARQYPQYDFEFVGRERLDLSSAENITEFFIGQHFDVIINSAAYTAVDKAEIETELAEQVNHLAVKQLAEIAKQQESVLIHISTDYVFNGQNFKPYIETDLTAPQSVYGATKLKGEQAIQEINPKGCIIRTSWVYSEYGNNFVKTMLRLGQERDVLNVIFDQVGTPTYAGDLADAILAILSSKFSIFSEETNSVIGRPSPVITSEAKQSTAVHDAKEQVRQATHVKTDTVISNSKLSIQNSTFCNVYHYSNEGVCSWYDFAKAIFAYSHTECQLSPIETKDYPTPATRPHYSLLNKSKIKIDFNLTIPYWQDSLKHCMQSLQEQKNER